MINFRKRSIVKLVSVVVVFSLILTVSQGVFAEKISKQKQTLIDIANGSDYLVGGGVPFEGTTQPEPGEITPQWSSGGSNHTHQYLTAKGLLILDADKGSGAYSVFEQQNGTSILLEYSDKPDVDENANGFACHFYDPTTGTNWLGDSIDTALTRFQSHYYNAVSYYNSGNKTAAWQQLGRALHFLQDVNEPHHAPNKVIGLSSHMEFESFTDQTRTNYGISTCDSWYYNFTRSYGTNVILDQAAIEGQYWLYYAESDWPPYMEIAARETMGKAQEYVASVLWKFLADVGY